MDNEMAINTYLSTTEYKKQTKQTRRTETESWIWRPFYRYLISFVTLIFAKVIIRSAKTEDRWSDHWGSR